MISEQTHQQNQAFLFAMTFAPCTHHDATENNGDPTGAVPLTICTSGIVTKEFLASHVEMYLCVISIYCVIIIMVSMVTRDIEGLWLFV